MKLYQTKYFDGADDQPQSAQWSGTQAQASKDRVSLKKHGKKDIETTEVDVPTSKEALMAFLNDNKVVVG